MKLPTLATGAARLRVVIVPCLSALIVTVAAAQSAPSDPSANGTAGMRVYVDPSTGALVEPPPGPDTLSGARAAGTAASTSAAGLSEVQGPTAAHGVSVDLQGRFRSAMSVGVGPRGETVTHCDTAPVGLSKVQP